MGIKKDIRSKKAFWREIKFKYRLTITNENTLEDVIDIRVSKANAISWLLVILLAIFSFTALVLVITPLKNYLPGYMNSEVRAQVVENALKADSLQRLMEKHQLYMMNIRDILRGEIKVDTIQSIDSLTVMRADSLMERTRREEAFQKVFEKNERYNLTAVNYSSDISGIIFYRPAKGMVTAEFDKTQKHYGVDIVVKRNESVLSTLDGTVIFAAYTVEAGYVIQIQHGQDLISVYKNCGTALKQEGDGVKAGEAIALIGHGKDGNDVPHLHFELWYRGRAVDPSKYIAF